MVIESHYWREDLIAYAKSFQPVRKPPRWSERLVVNFEKDVTVAMFMVRRLAEANRFSSKMKNHKAKVFRCAFDGKPHRLIYRDIEELYKLDCEEPVTRGPMFLCNQFIHADFTYAYRGLDRNWEGLYTSSDYQKKKWVYRVPLIEIVKILELAAHDYPSRVSWRYDPEKEDFVISTD
ncbi:hypothetical protein [Ruegeria sp. HKCCA4008]|uniref:hypothetical protein n=1 Tax=Ruegeria sp. HKCCA4008 TaxID=2682999 RepID=UPI00148956E6|nr:hypothetical protein [Ruegeria sp. HKCCA4008]